MKKYRYDYYTVKLPGDMEETMERLGQLAIGEAEDRARVYALPCEWTAKHVAGKIGDYEITFRVRRKRNHKGASHA